MGPDGRCLGSEASWSMSLPGHSLSLVTLRFPMTAKRQMSHLSSRRARRRIWGARGWSAPAWSLRKLYRKSSFKASPNTGRTGSWLGTASTDLPRANSALPAWTLSIMVGWLCGWRERSGRHIPRFQQGLWHCFLHYLYCQTSEIWTG